MSGKPAHCGCVQAVSFSWTSAVPPLTQEMQCMIHDTSDIRRGLDSIEKLGDECVANAGMVQGSARESTWLSDQPPQEDSNWLDASHPQLFENSMLLQLIL